MVKASWNWLVANKEWFFSGAGITAMGVLLWFWRKLAGFASSYLRGRQPVQKITSASPSQTSLEAIMPRTHILFIDDDVKFKVVNILQTAGWQNTLIVKDVASLDDENVKRAHILFLDINGVGKKLAFKDEGLGLALALKKRFPEKRVVIYSADTKAERFHEAWKWADDYLAKNADPYQFQQMVEEYAMQLGG